MDPPAPPPAPVGPLGLGFQGWGLRPEIPLRLGSGSTGLRPCWGFGPHQPELLSSHLEDCNMSLPPRPPSPCKAASRPPMMMQSEQTRKGFMMVEVQAGGGRACPRPPPPWVREAPSNLAYEIKPHSPQKVGRHRPLAHPFAAILVSGFPFRLLHFRCKAQGGRGEDEGPWRLDPAPASCLCPWPPLSLDKSRGAPSGSWGGMLGRVARQRPPRDLWKGIPCGAQCPEPPGLSLGNLYWMTPVTV